MVDNLRLAMRNYVVWCCQLDDGLAMEHDLCYGSYRSSGIFGSSMDFGGDEDGMVAPMVSQRLCSEECPVADAGEISNHQDSPMVCMVVSQE